MIQFIQVWWAHLGSNQGPTGYEPVALPLSYRPKLAYKIILKILAYVKIRIATKRYRPKPPPARSVPAGQGQSRLWTVPFRYTSPYLCKQEIFSIYGTPGLDRQSRLDKPSFCYYTTTEYLRIFSIYGAPGLGRITVLCVFEC